MIQPLLTGNVTWDWGLGALLHPNHKTALRKLDEVFGRGEGQVQLSIDGGVWVDVPMNGSDFAWEWDTSAEADGEHTLLVRAQDAAGHVTEARVTVTVDNTDPTIDVVTPTEGQYVGGTLVFQVAAADSQGMSSVRLSWDEWMDVPATLSALNNYYEYTLDTTTLADGTYTLTVDAEDASGRMSSISMDFNVDNTEPSLVLDGPLPDAILVGDVTVTVTVDDTFLDAVQYQVDDLGWVDIEGSEATLDTTALSDGDHVVTVRAIDMSGKVVSASSAVVVDNTAPAMSIASMPS